MSLIQTVGPTLTYARTNVATSTAFNECTLDNAFNDWAKLIADNVINFAQGTGFWLVLGAAVLGLLMWIFGSNNNLVKKAGIGILVIALIGVMVTIAGSLVGSNGC